MNEKDPQEIAYRRQAFKLFDKGKSAAEILALIPRSPWLFKWKQRFEQGGWQALDSLSNAPLNSPQQYSAEAICLVIRLRRRLEKSEVGLIGVFEIQREIRRRPLLKPVPSLSSIKRWLKDAGWVDTAPESEAEASVAAEDFQPVSQGQIGQRSGGRIDQAIEIFATRQRTAAHQSIPG